MYKTYMVIIFKVHRFKQRIPISSTKLCMNKYLLTALTNQKYVVYQKSDPCNKLHIIDILYPYYYLHRLQQVIIFLIF